MSASAKPSRLAQNWILDPVQDWLFIIATPVVVLLCAVAAVLRMDPVRGTAAIIVTHVVFTVAHHVPTYIRIYGDVDLFRRFKWSFIFGPLIPLGIAFGVLAYINAHGYPLQNFYYLLIILAVWDPWHFLMQHYGFMRIYDRPNAAPKKLAARMDFTLCASWFAYILLASGGWLPSVLRQLYVDAQIPVILAVPVGVLPGLAGLALAVAVGVTVAYFVYLAWCRSQGYFISGVKLALFLVTFAVMGLTYTPNAWILHLAPGWTFKAGFAVLGIVHVTQYMAIVWRFNRSLAARGDRARSGWFRTLHAKGGLLTALGYLAVCFAYGGALTRVHDNRWLMSIVLALGFTSTLMHYYFDGFIWKLRHKQNSEHLETPGLASVRMPAPTPSPAPKGPAPSWWGSGLKGDAPAVLLRQFLYFGVPMAVLTWGAWIAWHKPPPNYLAHVKQADVYRAAGRHEQTLAEARLALADLERQVPLAEKMADMEPTAAHEAELSELIYMRSVAREFSLPALSGQKPGPDSYARHLAQVETAIRLLRSALDRGGPLGYPGRENMSEADAQRSLTSWERVASQCRARLGYAYSVPR